MEEVNLLMKVTNLCLISQTSWVVVYSLKIDGIGYRYQVFKIAQDTELFQYPGAKPFYHVKATIHMNVTDPQQTIDKFYKILMLQ